MDDIEPTLSRRKALAGVLFSFALLLSIILFFGVVAKAFHLPNNDYYFVSRLVFWVCLAILFFYAAKIERQPLLMWKETKQSFSFYALSFMALICIIFFGSVIISLILKLTGLNSTSKNMLRVIQVFRSNMPLAVFTCLTAGVVEEFVFRGYLMPRLQLLVKKQWLVIVISSLLFGALHFGYGTIGNVAVPVFIGAAFAFHYYRYRNIRILMFCHFMWDLLVILINIAYVKK